jgi:exosortase A-associated hydrolase 1
VDPVKVTERGLAFGCLGETLVGVLSVPCVPQSVGVVIVVGGPQYRAGSHRQFVLLARRLAASGITTLRFDCRGMGDATGAMRKFEDFGPDILAAIDALRRAEPVVERIVLWGLCDAASAILLYCRDAHDPRIAGVVLVNPWVRSDASFARAQLKHYYSKRFFERAFWSKLASGGVDLRAAVR